MKSLRAAYDRNFLWWELALSATLAVAAVLFVEKSWGRSELNQVLDGKRENLYLAIASLAGSLLGFAVTTVSIILAFGDSPHLRILRDSKSYPQVFFVFFSAIKFLAITTLVAFVALFADRDTARAPAVTYVMLFFCLASAFRVYRCAWVLESIISIAVSKPRET